MSSDAQRVVPTRKLIEVALPLEKINEASAREKSIRHGHPSTLHLWWSRKPLATARAVLFAQLVDDPSSHPDRFPTEEAVAAERRRLHELIEQLVLWENSNNEDLLQRAHQEILDSTDGNPPPILDPFAGGGSIPLEAQRLGLEAHASDLNPVAVLINKALIEIPPKFAGRKPVFPGAADEQISTWPRATGLAEDVRRYGQRMRDEAEKRIGHLYPKAKLDDGTEATVIAWIWARIVACPNPACGIAMPLTSKWWLGKKKGKEAYVVPSVVDGKVRYEIGRDPALAPAKETDGTVNRQGATCIGCGTPVEFKYIRAEGQAGRMGAQLMATVAEGKRTRIYLAPTPEHEAAAEVPRPGHAPAGDLPAEALGFRVQAYGMTAYSDLFTARQLTALTTFSDLVGEARERVLADAIASGMPEENRLEQGGTDAAAYADAVATYLSLGLSKIANINNSLNAWQPSMNKAGHLFTGQAIPMIWDYCETPPLATHAGSLTTSLHGITTSLDKSPASTLGFASCVDAKSVQYGSHTLSTDPPYYDNIGYSDLSDFFYVWLRSSLRPVHPRLFGTMLVPKSDELVANPYRHDGKEGAHRFFEEGFREVFRNARKLVNVDLPYTVYYAFKQQNAKEGGEASTGWESLLEGMIRAGWSITATWPVRSERVTRLHSQGTNSLASSIVLSLRPRPDTAPSIDRRGFLAVLKDELPSKLKELQQGAIAPVDLPQAAIGPGMAVFSRYSGVLNDDGSKMTVRAALARINEILDEVLAEQEGDFDSETRFSLAWFRQHGFDAGAFGDADNLARARNASIEHLDRSGILTSRAGKVTLLSPIALAKIYADKTYDPSADELISEWEVVMHLTRALAADGIRGAGALLAAVPDHIDRDLCKELAFLLFAIAEDRKTSQVAQEFNALGTAWNDIVTEAKNGPGQLAMEM
ncbi:DUF1156 domain-containing protein [Tomitella fengzijianii]|uniref:DUF1156 domain-containing protein n=1 Tax=Tomitella fengzijianii TaxID=2597660 RepID=A0A516X3A9_9ACTN|nr:DUF1156 domain-containing protein [Tomitella fengzijianii]QDQ97121.1 DUF1156 domain-containing protein [Tomitella fengzijianii]